MGLMVSKIKLIKPPISPNRKYFLTTNQLFHHMVYHPQIRIMIFRHYIGYLNCIQILINNALLQDHLLIQINQMWILINSKELLEHLKSKAISKVSSIKTVDFSTLYTTIPHEQLKSRLSGLISTSICKNGSR